MEVEPAFGAVSLAFDSADSVAKIPVIGAALATATLAGTLALGMGIAKRNIKDSPEIQYAKGGYVSAGMVRGAYSSGDSVSALLQPGERVLSKEETKRYDEKQNNNQNIVVNVTINGLLNTPSQIDQTVRQSLIPAIRRAVQQGYALGV